MSEKEQPQRERLPIVLPAMERVAAGDYVAQRQLDEHSSNPNGGRRSLAADTEDASRASN